MRKRGVLAAMLTGVMLVLCGCGGMTTDEAKDYVKSALDAGYKAEFKEYAEITDSTEKEAKKEYETNLDNSMKEAGFDETGVSDELKANYRKLFEKMNNPTYGDKTTVTVNVKVDKDGAYYIPQKDLTAVDDALFPEDAL